MSYMDFMDDLEVDFGYDWEEEQKTNYPSHYASAPIDAYQYPQPFRPIGTPYRPIGRQPRPRFRCCIYRHRQSGRIRKICQGGTMGCSRRLGRNWILIDSFTTNNCNRCL